jgi:predicted phosphodiesterase
VEKVAIVTVIIACAVFFLFNADNAILTDRGQTREKSVEEATHPGRTEVECPTGKVETEKQSQEPPVPSQGDEPEKPLFTFVHLTDTHCLTTKSNPRKAPRHAPITLLGIKMDHWKDLVNSFDILSEAVKYINEEVKPDFVIHTGDITDKGGLSDLKESRKILDTLKCPYHACQGDHDVAKTEGVYNYLKIFERRCASFDCRDWHFVMMGIYPSEKELKWLEEDLNRNSRKKVVFFTHRLVIATRFVLFAFKKAGVACLMPEAEKVRNILKKHGSVVMVLSGHVHMNLSMREEGMDTAFISTDALGERPHQFKVFKVYDNRMEITLFTGHTAESIEKGKWTSGTTHTLMLDREPLKK